MSPVKSTDAKHRSGYKTTAASAVGLDAPPCPHERSDTTDFSGELSS
jgi:hypothetical protein